MFLTFVSQLPLIPVRKPTDLVTYNQVMLMLALAIYLTLGCLIYMNKIPETILAYLPPIKWLAGLVVLDLALYTIIHRFQFGLFPVLSLQQLPNSGTPYLVEDQTGGGQTRDGQHGPDEGGRRQGGRRHGDRHQSSKRRKKRRTGEDSSDELSSREGTSEMDLTAEEVDELSSILKNHQQHGGGRLESGRLESGRLATDQLESDQGQMIGINEMPPAFSEQYEPAAQVYPAHYSEPAPPDPVEVSVTDGDYFQKGQETIVENWDADEEFSNMEYVDSKKNRRM